MFPCAGFVIFNKQNEIILVETHNGNYSFPKGKRNKNETTIETAYRELHEETGIEKNNVQIIDDFYIDEKSNNGNPSVRYFVGHLIDHVNIFNFDINELKSVGWYDINDALKIHKLKDSRKMILKKLLNQLR